jgi:hypothetical protein
VSRYIYTGDLQPKSTSTPAKKKSHHLPLGVNDSNVDDVLDAAQSRSNISAKSSTLLIPKIEKIDREKFIIEVKKPEGDSNCSSNSGNTTGSTASLETNSSLNDEVCGPPGTFVYLLESP